METSTSGRMPTYPDLRDKVAVVTGSSRGIGAATARLLAANGAKVVVNGRNPGAVDDLVRDITSKGGRAIGAVADVTAMAAIERMRERVERELGPADLLAAFPGGHGDPVPTAELTEEAWRLSVDANLTATFLTVRSFLPGMIERRRGAIVTAASSAGRQPSLSSAAYAAAKAGIVMFTRHVAREVGRFGVRINCVSPGAVLTEGSKLSRVPEEVRRQVAAANPLGRYGVPDDVAAATLFLLSDASSWITGVTLDVTGGGVIV